MDDKNYDEFGHYIGPDIPDIDNSSLSSHSDSDVNEEAQGQGQRQQPMNQQQDQSQSLFNNIPHENYQIVLHEDKNFYPEANEIYPGVENLVMEEDAQPFTEPIIPSIQTKKHESYETSMPNTTFDFNYMAHLMTIPELIRNIAVAGSLHHGKTSLIDIFIQLTHNSNTLNLHHEVKYLDSREDEQKRGLSIKSKPISLVLPNSKGKHYIINMFDTPGHSNFFDEVESAFRMSDGVLIVVDVVEGVTQQTKKVIEYSIRESIDMILVLNKIDRLILELKLPPNDAYFKIKTIIDDFNKVVIDNSVFNIEHKKHFVSPILNNIVFMSSLYGMCFTLESYAKKYSEVYKNKTMALDYKAMAKFLWGDVYYDKANRKFTKEPVMSNKDFDSSVMAQRTFVLFVLNPLYKLIGYSLSEEKEQLSTLLNEMNIKLKDSEYKMDPKPLLKRICHQFYGHFSYLIDSIVNRVVDAKIGAQLKIRQYYQGDRSLGVYPDLIQCSPNGTLAIQSSKMYHKPDHSSFDVFGRILSGTITKGQKVNVLGENYNVTEQEDVIQKEVKTLWIYQTRYKVEINKASIGNWILMDSLDIAMSKSATITSIGNNSNSHMDIFKPLSFNYSYMKVSVEPLNPSELPKMIDGLRKINKSYPACKLKVEESGENIILGTGELFMDTILYDLRQLYTDIELKVSDPVVTFCETVTETSSFKCIAETHNKKNSLSMIAQPLEKEIVNDIDQDLINIYEDKRKYLIDKHNWDILTAKSVWAFGPNGIGSDVLIDYTLPSETDKTALESIRDSVIQGFDWACREGPLCNEPIRNVKFKLLSASITQDPLFKASGQIIPTARRVCYSSFLTATPKLMEPFLIAEITCPIDCLTTIGTLLMRRRGHINSERPMPGTPFYVIDAVLPALDSFGFETDIRTTTAGQAFCLMWFDHWNVMPGDPLDRTLQLKPLEPSTPDLLAREAMIKTRRRKGLIEDVAIGNFFSEKVVEEMKLNDEYKNYFCQL